MRFLASMLKGHAHLKSKRDVFTADDAIKGTRVFGERLPEEGARIVAVFDSTTAMLDKTADLYGLTRSLEVNGVFEKDSDL